MQSIVRWEDLESEIWTYLEGVQRAHPVMVHRFTDSKAAGNLVREQPADFMSCSRLGTTFIEAKFSEVHDSLRSSFSGQVRGHQLASARLAHRAGQRYLFVFYSSCSRLFELWDGFYCSQRRSEGRRLESSFRIAAEHAPEGQPPMFTLAKIFDRHVIKFEDLRKRRSW